MIALACCGRYNIRTTGMSGGGITLARNKIAHMFLKSDADRILWVDSDISFTPEQVDALWELDLPYVGAFYSHKTTKELRWSARGLGVEPDATTGLVKLAAIGTGFLMVKREVFNAIRKRYPDECYIEDWADGKGEEKYGYFKEGRVLDPEMGIEKPTWLTEDWYFAYLARCCGYTVWGASKVIVGHWDGGTMHPIDQLA